MTDDGRREPFVSLKEHFDERLKSLEKMFTAGMASAERAVEIFEKSAEKWRLNANEWRAAMDDRESRFATKVETANLTSDIDELKARVDRAEGRSSGINAAWGIVILLAMLALGALQVYLKP